MRSRLLELRERQARLAVLAEGEREQLAVQLARADTALAWLQRGRSVLEAVRRQPLLLAAGVLLVMAWRPRRILKLLASGWSLWRLYRQVQLGWQRLAPRARLGTGGRP